MRAVIAAIMASAPTRGLKWRWILIADYFSQRADRGRPALQWPTRSWENYRVVAYCVAVLVTG